MTAMGIMLRHKQNGCTLGMMVRALRMGYAPVHAYGGFMRLSGGDDGKPFLCELRPFGLIPNSAKSDIPHWVWWATADAGGIQIERIEGLQPIRRVKLPFSFYFDDDGKTI